MDWAVWTLLAALTLIVGGLLVLRRLPLRDANGDVVDEFGRPVAPLDRQARRVVQALLSNRNQPMTTYDIRCVVDIPRVALHEVIDRLETLGLLVSATSGDLRPGTTFKFRYYRLTDRGVVEAQRPSRIERGRHRS